VLCLVAVIKGLSVQKILLIQHGDFGEAYQRFAENGPETYRDQKKSVDFVSGLAPSRAVTTLTIGDKDYGRVALADNLFACGIQQSALTATAISNVFDAVDPTHVILRSPYLAFLREANRRKLKILPCFADIFEKGGARQTWRNLKLRRALLRAQSPCISNHSLNASRSLAAVLRMPPERIVPWDWSAVPSAGSEKAGVCDMSCPSAFFAGALTAEKGVGDCLHAIARLHKDDLSFRISFAGGGDIDRWQHLARELNIDKYVRFLGMVPNAQVREGMRSHDFVLVPSRHSYAEGLPNTIYEALASRSVLVMSDHPAFAGRLVPDRECIVFPAADPKALAEALKRATTSTALYKSISRRSLEAHDRLYVGMEWTDLIEAFLSDPADATGWVADNSLATLDS
jgi:glycosyltransferase involved in cell wall biosynthesis